MKSLPTAMIACGAALLGQNGPIPVGSGYTFPAPFYAAPGQLVTLIVAGIGNTFSNTTQASPGANLPTSLAGVSVGYFQGNLTGPLPILEVTPFWTCGGNPYYCGPLLAVTAQIPFEAQCTPCASNGGVSGGQLGTSVNGSATAVSIYTTIVSDQVHILTSCDTFLSPVQESVTVTPLPCPSIVAHADGSLVSATSPAKAGEELVAYAVGLGQTTPVSATGRLVSSPVPTAATFILDFNYHPNALPSRPLPTAPSPLFAGATPGYVGLYQINFAVPRLPAGTPPCVNTAGLPLGSNVVQSNLTVSVGGAFSFDGARICVAP